MSIIGKPGRGCGGGAVPGRINHFLREYQREGVRFLWHRFTNKQGAVLADDMGRLFAMLLAPCEFCPIPILYLTVLGTQSFNTLVYFSVS